jgi:hypothetical protein
MTPNQLMLKATVLTALMQTVQAKGRAPTAQEREAVEQFNNFLEQLPEHAQAELDLDIDAVFPDLLAAIDCIVELPRIALA